MAAETGSGKTAAFCLPIIQIVWETLKDMESGKGMKVQSNLCKYKVCSIFRTLLKYLAMVKDMVLLFSPSCPTYHSSLEF